jgi:Sec-independent protein translocase protein TatA
VPELGKSLGHGLKEFKSSVTSDDDHKSEDAARARLEATTTPAETTQA